PLNPLYRHSFPTRRSSDLVWSLINVAYLAVEERNTPPWIIESVKPIQISNVDIQYYKEVRSQFSTTEWMDLLMQSIGLNPEEFRSEEHTSELQSRENIVCR